MTEETNNNRKQAVVKWFNPRTGYGFLTDLITKEDIFVHHKGIKTDGDVYRTLITGEYVCYDLSNDASGKKLASNVTGIADGPLMCQRPRPNRTRDNKRGPKGRKDQDEQDLVGSEE